MDRSILLKLPEELYQQVLKLAVDLSQQKGTPYSPGDIIRAAITYALKEERKL